MALNRPPKPLPIFFRIIRRFWPSIRKQRVLIAGSFLALAGEISFRLLEPWPLKFIFDGLITTKHSRRHIPDWIHGLDPMTMVCLASLALIAITMLRALADYWNTVGFSLAGNRVLTEVRNELYRHLQRLSLSFHTRTRNGDLALRVIGDVNMLKDATVTALLPLMASSLVLIGMPIVMLWLNWQLALLALVPTPLMWISTMRLGKRIREAARKQRRRQGEIAATAAESMGAIQIVQALSLEGRFSEYFDARSRTEQNEDIKGSRLSARLGRTVEGLLAISMSLVLVHGVWLIQHRVLTPGDLLVFLGYLKSAFRPIRELAKYASRLSKALAAGERVLDIFEQTPDVRDLPDAVPAPAFQGQIRFDSVSFAYDRGPRVLDKIEFEVQKGQHVALVGPSGIGKSTLVSLILRFYDPIEGRVMIDGRDIREYTLESLRSQISVVLQEGILFATSLRDNIAYGSANAESEQIEAAARLANAREFIQDLPEGYDTVVGERGVTLSAGQRQRIAIARAAIRKAPILILDEPTTGLDEENEREVMSALDNVTQGVTTFLITHDLRLASRADVIIYLEKGSVVEHGVHADLIRRNGRYARLYRAQTGVGHPIHDLRPFVKEGV